jgi:peptide/nickel transport system substrate-binding protein
MKKAAVILMSLLVCTFLVVGSGPVPATPAAPAVPVSVLLCPQGPPPPGLVPQYGGTLKMLHTRSPSNIGAPWKPATGIDRPQGRFVLESLVGLDAKGDPAPQLATSWNADPANKTITFTLRQGVKFHDGTDFNAEAVKWNMDTYRKGPNQDLKLVTSVDVIDNYHIRLTLSGWDPLFISSLASTSAGRMVSPTAAQKLGDEALRTPVGTGPFKLDSLVPNVSMKFSRFNGYWQKGLPYLDGVEINYVSDPVVRLASFTKGEANVINEISTRDAMNFKKQGKTVIKRVAHIGGLCADIKNPTSPFNDIRVRQAIAYAIDTNAIVDSVFDGMYTPTNQLALPGLTAYDTTIKGYPYSPAKAQELLAAAGYSTANPLKTKIVYTVDPQKADFYTMVQGYLKKVGIDVTLEPIDNAGYTKLMSSGWNNHLLEYQFSYNGFELKYANSLVMALSENSARYKSVVTPEAFNALYNSMVVENDMAKREAAYKKLNKMAIDDYCLVFPFYGWELMNVRQPNVQDFGWGQLASEFLPERAWLSK